MGNLQIEKNLKPEVLPIVNKSPGIFGARHLQTFLLFIGLMVAYALRVNLSVAIVAMVDRNSTNPDFDEYDWSPASQSLILSSFFWGYIITQIPAGHLAQKYGPKTMLMIAIFICSVLNILTPIGASLGSYQLVCALRVMQGLCQGFIFPSTHTLLSKWAPVTERARLATYCYSGTQVGTVVMLSSSGLLASSSLGWPSIFYLSGAAGVLWSILWFFFGANSPCEYKNISPEEKEFIATSLGTTDDGRKKQQNTPWKEIFTSRPFIALIIVHCGHNWGFWTLLTEMPTYMKNILEFDIKKNASLSALPYFAMAMLSYIFSFIADIILQKGWLSVGVSRKLFNTIGHWGPMLALIGLGYVTKENTTLAVQLLTLAVGINAGTYLGFQVNHIDLSPNQAGILMGITNAAANVMSIIAPLAVGFVIKDTTNPEEWRTVFFISAAVYFFGNLIFICFSKAEVQPWNEPKKPMITNNNKNRNESHAVEAQD